MLIDVPAPDLKSLRILIANSNAYSRSILRIALRTLGVRDVVEAGDLDTALRLALSGSLQAVIIEQDSLGFDGATLARMIRRIETQAVSRLPLVMVAAQANAASVNAARDSGVNAFLLRPLSAATVKARILAALCDRRPFVAANAYVGPDRRFRCASQGFPPRRFGDDTPNAEGDRPASASKQQTK